MIAPVAGILGGVLLGVVFTASPLTFSAVLLAAVLVASSGMGLPHEQRRTLFLICATGLGVRLVAVVAMLVVGIPHHNDLATGALSGDESYYLSRALRARDLLLDHPVTKYDYVVAYDEYGYSSYVPFLTWLQVIAGPTPYSMRLINAVLFAAGALLLFRVALRAYGSLPAFLGLALLFTIPSLAASSISLLKEPLYFAASALLLTCALVALARGHFARRVAAIAAAILALALLDELRRGALVLAVGGLGLGLVMRLVFLRWWTAGATALAAAGVVAVVVTSGAMQQRVIQGLESAAKLHSGHVFTVGHAYKLLDEGFYVNPQASASSNITLTASQATRFVIRGIGSFILEPLPWQMASKREVLFLPELLLWYCVVLLIPVGVWAGWRRNPMVTSLLVCYPLPTAAALALTTGNVGTLFRLRGLVWPYLLWLSALGFLYLIARLTRRTDS